VPRWPVDTVQVTPHGAYAYQRTRRRHHGVDLAGQRGTLVRAPERLAVLIVARGNSPGHARAGTVERSADRLARGVRLDGYGPAAVMARGLDTGMVHVLGHLEPAALPTVDATLEEGAPVGTISRVGHVHWEVRQRDRYPWPRADRGDDTYDPGAWLEAATHLPFSSPATHDWLVDATDAARATVTAVTSRARERAAGEVLGLVVLALLLGGRRRS